MLSPFRPITIEEISRQYLGTPYQANTLIGGPDIPEQLVERKDVLDCFTFLDHVLSEFLNKELKDIRYKDGIISYETRNHYFSDWIENNGLLSLGYTDDLSRLKTGDFVGFYSPKPDLDVSHVGIVIGDKLRHASSRFGKVIDEKLEKRKYLVARVSSGLVDIKELAPDIKVDLKYSSKNNFMNQDLYEDEERCLLQPEVAMKLAKAAKKNKFLIFDCARPKSVQEKMWQWAKENNKEKFIASPGNSLHNYGVAVDLTIQDKDMGTPYDYFGIEPELSLEQKENRELLKSIMQSAGFKGISNEWWHFNGISLKEAKEKYELIE